MEGIKLLSTVIFRAVQKRKHRYGLVRSTAFWQFRTFFGKFGITERHVWAKKSLEQYKKSWGQLTSLIRGEIILLNGACGSHLPSVSTACYHRVDIMLQQEFPTEEEGGDNSVLLYSIGYVLNDNLRTSLKKSFNAFQGYCCQRGKHNCNHLTHHQQCQTKNRVWISI